jgi:NADH-quinone oxidoreductase subunit G
MLRDGGELRPVSWERALEEAAARLKRAGASTGAIVGGGTTNEEGFLLARLMREGVGSPHIDSRVAGTLPLELHRALAEPGLQAKVPDLEFAHAVLVLECNPIEDAAILDLRLRKGVRRRGMKLVRAGREQLLDEAKRDGLLDTLRAACPPEGTPHNGGQAGLEVVVLWHERLAAGPDGERAVRALLDLTATLGLAEIDGAGLLEVPAHANGRGLREAGVLPNAGPGLSETDEDGLDAQGIAEAFERGELTCLYLLGVDPPTRGPGTVIAHAAFLTDALREQADVVFPAEAYPEQEGTVTHPDGRIQRVRRAVRHIGETRDERQVLDDLTTRIGLAP